MLHGHVHGKVDSGRQTVMRAKRRCGFRKVRRINTFRSKKPSQFVDLTSFVNARRLRSWPDALEWRRQFIAGVLAHLAQHPQPRSVSPDAPRFVGAVFKATGYYPNDLDNNDPVRPSLTAKELKRCRKDAPEGDPLDAPLARWLRCPSNDPEGRPPDTTLTDDAKTLLRRRRLTLRAGLWSSLAEGLPPACADYLRPILRQLENAEEVRWHMCACGRVFVAKRNTWTCTACRRRRNKTS